MSYVEHSLPGEKWREVPGYAGLYLASSFGRIWSVRKNRVARLTPSNRGYLSVTLSGIKGARRCRVNRVIASAFFGVPSAAVEVNHMDGVKANNRASNLEYVTPQQNMAHAAAHGLVAHGERCHTARLTPEKVAEIFECKQRGMSSREIGATFGVWHTTVQKILDGKSWARLGLAHRYRLTRHAKISSAPDNTADTIHPRRNRSKSR